MDLHRKYGLRRVLNAYDKATSLSGAVVAPEVVEVVRECLGHCYELDALQNAAGRAIAAATGAEWGCVTACAAAGITLGIAASMTGSDLDGVRQLPDPTGLRHRVVIQQGHCINFGVPVTQMIRLSGADVVEVGGVASCRPDEVRRVLESGDIAAVMAVESYHTAGYHGVSLSVLADLAHAAGVPLVLDAATQELRLRDLVATGADLVLGSAHKYLSATTAGVVAGRRELVEAVKLQNHGIGRGMKAGKEAIFGVMAAFESPVWRNPAAWSAREQRKAARLVELLAGCPGIEATLDPDPNGCPFQRVRVAVDPAVTGYTPQTLRAALAAGDPTLVVRVYRPDCGCIYLNATEMSAAEVEEAGQRLRAVLA